MRVSLTPADTCEADCMRKRAEQSLQAAIKTLRKSIGRQQFSVQVAGTEYEVAQRPAKAPEGQGACGTGQVLQDGKCGESLPPVTQMSTLSSLPHAAGQTAHEGGDREARGQPERSTVALTVMAVMYSAHALHRALGKALTWWKFVPVTCTTVLERKGWDRESTGQRGHSGGV